MASPYVGAFSQEAGKSNFTCIALNRLGSEVEGGRCPTTTSWKQAPGVKVTVNSREGYERTVHNNHLTVKLLCILLDGHNMIGN